MVISAQEQSRRAERVRQSIHSAEMEGGHATDETRAILDAYAAGDIDDVAVMQRIRLLYSPSTADSPEDR